MDTTNMLNEVPGTGTTPQPSPEPAAPTLADVIGVTAEAEKAGKPETTEIPPQEPGWYAKRRAQDRAQWDAEHKAAMDQMQQQVNSLREYWLNQEADKLVDSGKITDRDLAIEYLRNKEGVPAPQPAAPQPRDEKGRFTPSTPEVPNELQQRANELFTQAKTLQKVTGVDVLALYRSNAEYAAKINSGEWDMADVLSAHTAVSGSSGVAPLVRSPNGAGAGLGGVSIGSMTSDQFSKLNEMLERGGRIDMRK